MAPTPAPRAPRLTTVRLSELKRNEDRFISAGDTHDGQYFDRPVFDGLDLSATDFLECELQGPTFHDAQLRGVRFRDAILRDSFAPVLLASRTSWRDVEITSPRWGSAELYDSTWASVRIDGGKVDFLNLRGTDFHTLTGVGSMAGAVIDDYQLGLLAPILAGHLGITVA
ncbi:pentapeptide repeat-containing protein [Specibacter sp. RAF43]|uniref:pentapeptide repeat-containing protein n=1 Tax=Specibacter sp. RAF43 TaxID=3233057 RepID=UPI003F9DD92C